MINDKKNMSISIEDSERVTDMLERILKENGIPSRPAIIDCIHTEMGKPEPDLNLLARIIGADVALAGGLISIANSLYYGFHGRVRSVNETLMMLGMEVSCRAIAGLILRKLFPMTLVLERFWDASANIARLSGWIAQHPDIGFKIHANDAYTYALFRDAGIAVLLNRFPYYQEVLIKANEEKILSFTEIEEIQSPTNHAMIGSFLAQSWWLPEEVCTAIRLHHEYTVLHESDTTFLPPATRGLIAIAQLAEHIFQQHTSLSMTQEWFKSSEVCLETLELDESQLMALYKESVPVLANSN